MSQGPVAVTKELEARRPRANKLVRSGFILGNMMALLVEHACDYNKLIDERLNRLLKQNMFQAAKPIFYIHVQSTENQIRPAHFTQVA